MWAPEVGRRGVRAEEGDTSAICPGRTHREKSAFGLPARLPGVSMTLGKHRVDPDPVVAVLNRQRVTSPNRATFDAM